MTPHPKWTLSWMRLCEARHVARLPKAERDAYLKTVAEKRGRDGALALWDMVRDEYRRMRDAPHPSYDKVEFANAASSTASTGSVDPAAGPSSIPRHAGNARPGAALGGKG